MKRLFDFFFAVLILIVLAPLLVLIALVVRLLMGKPVFFVQVRPGRGSKPFHLYKFRTMSSAVDEDGCPLPDADRLTKFGAFLRSTSLDELPELWNILRGDMSFVGPRPLLTAYLTRYSNFHARRHEVRPGLTGWAQIHGRNATTWQERLDLDVWYVDNRTWSLDLRILGATFLAVMKRRGISADGHATMPEFGQE